MALRQICVIELSLTYFRLTDVCVDIACQSLVLILGLTLFKYKLYTLNDINLAQRQIKNHCKKLVRPVTWSSSCTNMETMESDAL